MAKSLRLKVFLTGRVAAEANGRVLNEARFPGRQGRLLFVYLVAAQSRPVSTDELADAIWGESPPATWEKALTVIASKLRGLVAEDGITLTNAFGCYRLDLPEGTWVDLFAAASAAQDAEDALAAGELDHARAAAESAESLAGRPFLSGEDGAWVEQKRRDLADIRERALSVLADACLRSGAAREAAKCAEELIALSPFREAGYRRLMEAHVVAGNRAEALRVYEQCRQLLAEELGAYPSPESEAVYLEILRSSPGGSDSEIKGLATDGRRPESPPKNDEPPRRGRGKVAPIIAGALLVGGKCDDCGATLPQYSKFCPECGHAVGATPSPATYTPGHLRDQILAIRSAIEGERKQVSVVFCDIVRSPELAAQAGPEEYHRVVDSFFALALAEVHRFEGTVNQFLGDGFMALFGAPIAHEDHARRAALAALAIKERSEIDVRIGLNSGSVVVGAIGDDLRMDYTASGDTTVLAARLHGAARPGDVLVSTATAGYLRGYFDLHETEPVTVNERTVHALRVIGRGPRTSSIDEAHQQLTPFSGRHEELESLRQALRSAAEGQGQVIGISGDPGLGKSRLAHELRLAAEEDTVALQGRCLPFGTAVPYLPILDLVREACGIASEDDRESVAAKISATLEELHLDPDSHRYLHHALDVTSGDAQLVALEPATLKGRTFEALRGLLLAKASRPLLLVIEDAQWIDRTSEEFLTELVDELPSVPALLLATYRPGYNPPWLGKSYVTQIALRPLSREAGEQIVAAILGDANDATETIVGRGEGNPFFLEELARAARQETDSRSDGSIPTTVQDVLAARIDRLDARDKSAVRIASVLGREFSLDLIESVWDGDGALLPALDELKRREFLHEQHGGTERTFAFKHALTRDVAYDGLLEERRRYLHARAGAAVERFFAGRLHEKYELLAFHYSRSSERERAADYLELANRKASAQHAMDEALGYFYEALAIFEGLPDSKDNRRRRLTLVLDQTSGFHYLHRHVEYHELLLRHEPLALEQNDPGLVGAFYDRLAHRQMVFGEYEQGRETGRQALELCERSGNHEHAALACNTMQWAHMLLGEYGSAHPYAARAHEHLAVSFDPMAYMYARAGAALTYMMAGRWEAALHEVDEAVATGTERSDAGMVSFCNAIAALVCVEKRDWATALDYGNAAKETAPTVYFRGFAFGFMAPALCHTGAVDEGLPILEQIVPMAKAARHEMAWTVLASRLADAYLTAGDYERAHQTLLEIHGATARSGAKFFLGASGRGLAEVALAQGDPEEAIRRLEAAIETLRASGSENQLGLALGALGRARRLVGDDVEARALTQEALAILDRLGTLEEPDRLRDELAALPV
ncbi:MAG TPA: AAA family ATPase [Gaiellaceae bacterium]|jgi:class 3 adenylate cyclase/DNA-binding SARP family transcriptional activator|nr:AAA family ATPase [Gaiellaceae bacterium]